MWMVVSLNPFPVNESLEGTVGTWARASCVHHIFNFP